MSRRRVAEKREILPDPKYGDQVLAKFINIIMRKGKKSTAEKIVYGALDEMGTRTKGGDPLELFNKALGNVKPVIEVKSRRVGGATYQIPVEVRADRSIALAMRWLVDAAKKRSEKNMGLRLAGELLEASENRGGAIKKREDTHKMAEANKAFSHYRW
jgi:small subunit ribosomal protein S7